MGVAAEQSDAASEGAYRDADQLDLSQLAKRPLPGTVAGRERQFQVVFADAVVEDIRAHGLASPDVEVCGVLVGNIYRDNLGPYCHISANIRGNHATGQDVQVTFTAETWNEIHQTMDNKYPDDRIVGWYHTHPGFGIFLSGMDLFIQENFFNESWQVAYVDDPKGGDRGVFVWEKNKPIRRPYLTIATTAEGEKAAGQNSSAIDSLVAAARARTEKRVAAPHRKRNRTAVVILSILLIAGIVFLFWSHLFHFFH